MSPWALNRIVGEMARGAVIGYPTDTVWGLGCHPLLAASVARILEIKGREPGKGLILLSSSLDYCLPYLDAAAADLAALLEPSDHPITWRVPAGSGCPPWIRGDHPTVAVRITDHPAVGCLCDGLVAPLVSTSANRSGRPTVRSALQMRRQFGDEVDYVIGGFKTGGNRPSEIKSLLSGDVIRSKS